MRSVQAENQVNINPNQAVVRRVEDKYGNVSLTVLTPVTPIQDEKIENIVEDEVRI